MRVPPLIDTIASYIKEIWKEYHRDNGSLIAAAISFYNFLSLFPLLLFSIGILGMIIGSPQRAEDILLRFTGGFLAGPETTLMIRQVIHGSNAATGIGLVVLLWSGTTAVVVINQAINMTWCISSRRSFLKQRAVALLVLIVAGLLVAISIIMTAEIHRFQSSGYLHRLTWFWNMLGYMIPLLVSILTFTFIYEVLPWPFVRIKAAFMGGLFSGVLFEVAKHAFTWYVIHFASYNKVYGSLGGVILLLVWINYSAVITIFGAEFADIWAKRHRYLPARES